MVVLAALPILACNGESTTTDGGSTGASDGGTTDGSQPSGSDSTGGDGGSDDGGAQSCVSTEDCLPGTYCVAPGICDEEGCEFTCQPWCAESDYTGCADDEACCAGLVCVGGYCIPEDTGDDPQTDCDSTEASCTDCQTCAEEEACRAYMETCLADPGCSEMSECVDACETTDLECVETCLGGPGNIQIMYYDWRGCSVCIECPTLCEADAFSQIYCQ